MNDCDTPDVFILFGNNNFALKSLHICYHYNPLRTNYDERGIGLQNINGKWFMVTERFYY